MKQSEFSLGFRTDVQQYNLRRMAFVSQTIKRKDKVFGSESWTTDEKFRSVIESLPELYKYYASHSQIIVSELEGALVEIDFSSVANISIEIGAPDMEVLNNCLIKLHELFPRKLVEENRQVIVNFWGLGQHGPVDIPRAIDVPSWADVKSNYSKDVVNDIEDLILTPELEGGKLILWSGPPGTGKTYAIRAMGWEWRKWADIHYITDPEVFFGEHSLYMLSVLLNDSENTVTSESSTPGRWKIILLEDTGEMLSADAKQRVGQGLSRLLNVVDGIIGQGLRIVIMLTTNEEIGFIHPAVSRPGRCLNSTKFTALSKNESNAWLREEGHDITVSESQSIAQLYALIEGRKPQMTNIRPLAGFAKGIN